MGIEPTSSAWKAEVLPLNYTRETRAEIRPQAPNRIRPDSHALVEGVGFEPTKAEPSDLQSGPFGRSGTPPQRKRHILLDRSHGVKPMIRRAICRNDPIGRGRRLRDACRLRNVEAPAARRTPPRDGRAQRFKGPGASPGDEETGLRGRLRGSPART